jgi:DNA-binding GntR family transcriptional regulator
MATIKREILSSQVLEVLKEMISNHRFKPGTRLNVEQLAKEFGVSRTPVWEAVRRLEQEGLVVNEPNRGVFMAVLTPEMAIALYEVRTVLEDLAGQLAARRIKDQTLRMMEKCLAKQKQVIEKQDLIGYSRLDFEFHAAVYQSCGNPYLQEFLEAIKNKMRPITMHIEPILPRLYQDHEEILEALKARVPKKTGTVLREHSEKMIKQIERSIHSKLWSEESNEPTVHYAPKQRRGKKWISVVSDHSYTTVNER